MASEDRPLDEVVWSSPASVQRMGFIHTNTVHPYFAESPFFDSTSNNAIISNQAMFNPAMFHVITSRVAFEGHLRSMAGLEFMVTHDPSEGDRTQDHSGVWVIRKQTRRKRPGQEDEITPHSSYFVVGDRVYMAPSVGGILESRVLSTVTALTKLISTASSLPIFNPAVGRTYYAASSKAEPTTKDALSTAQHSREATPVIQEGSTSVPEIGRSLGSTPAPRASSKSSAAQDASLLMETLRLSERFGFEYMDETPLSGEPGAFVLGKTSSAGASKLANVTTANNSVNGAATEGTTAESEGQEGAIPTTVNGKPGAPPALKIDLLAEDRKRSKGGEKSPTSASPLTPGGGKKRKKSKVAGVSGGKITPT